MEVKRFEGSGSGQYYLVVFFIIYLILQHVVRLVSEQATQAKVYNLSKYLSFGKESRMRHCYIYLTQEEYNLLEIP